MSKATKMKPEVVVKAPEKELLPLNKLVNNPDAIKEHLAAREAELRQVIQTHDNMMKEVQRITRENQAKVYQLEANVAMLKEMLPKEEEKK